MHQYNFLKNNQALKHYRCYQVRNGYAVMNDNYPNTLAYYLFNLTKPPCFNQNTTINLVHHGQFKQDCRINPERKRIIPIEESSTNRPQFHPL